MFVNLPRFPLLYFSGAGWGLFERTDVEIQSGETDFFLFFFGCCFPSFFFEREREE